jgi:hypothetical protein
MKTQKSTSSNKVERADTKIPEHAEAGFLIGFIILTLLTLVMAACSDDDEIKGPDTRAQFVGTYNVEDISQSSGYVYEYTVTVSEGSGNEIKFSNFADLFNVPVKATVSGNTFNVPMQSFTNPSGKTIKVSGSGSIQGGVLTFNYTTEGYLDYTGACTATKNN